MIIDRVNPDLAKYAEKELEKMVAKCKPCEVIIHRIIQDRKIMSDHWVRHYGKEALERMYIYAYYKGMVDIKSKEDREFARSVIEKLERGEAVK